MVHNRWLYFRMLPCGALPQPWRNSAAPAVWRMPGKGRAAAGSQHAEYWRGARADFTFQTARPSAALNTVIASEAKQSILSLRGAMDCFASLAMTA